jgi:hypothetical protein
VLGSEIALMNDYLQLYSVGRVRSVKRMKNFGKGAFNLDAFFVR